MSKILRSQRVLIELLVPLSAAKEVKAFHAQLSPAQITRRALRSPSLQVALIDPKTGKKTEAQPGSPHRLKVIDDTNLRTARAAGQWQRIEETKEVSPYLLYETVPSLKHREQHLAWAGLVLPVDDPLWHTHMPPNGWGCKCRVRPITQSQTKRRGVSHTPALTPTPAKRVSPSIARADAATSML